MAGKNYFFSGISELIILAILNDHDSYVYDIVKYIRKGSKGCLSISQNTIYAVTYKLLAEGKITEYSKLVGKRRTRVYYHLEPAGVSYYEQLSQSYKTAQDGLENILQDLSEKKGGEENE